MKRWKIAGLVLLCLVLIGSAAFLGYRSTQAEAPGSDTARSQEEVPETVAVERGDVQKSVIAPGILVNYDQFEVLSELTGVVDEVLVKEGQRVEAGDLLLRYGNTGDMQSRLESAELALTVAEYDLQALYDDLDVDRANAELAVYEAQQNLEDATEARERLNYARCGGETIEEYYLAYKQAEKYLDEVKNGSPSRAEITQAEAQFNTAQANYVYCTAPRTENELATADAQVEAANAKLDAANKLLAGYRDGPNPADVARAELAQMQAQDELDAAQAALDAVELCSPMDGVILDVKVLDGSAVSSGTALFLLADPGALEVVVSVQEEDYPLIFAGQAVDLFVEAAPDLTLTGRVDRILPKRISNERPLYSVYIALDDVPSELVEGMTVDASILLDSRQDVLRLPRSLAHVSSDGSATLPVWENGRIVQREIHTGLRGDVYVEILDGLEAGDLVVTQ